MTAAIERSGTAATVSGTRTPADAAARISRLIPSAVVTAAVAAVTAAIAAAVTARRTLRLRTGHVHRKHLAFELAAVDPVDGFLPLAVIGISTNPNPRERPVSRSVITFADDTSPNCANKFCKLSLLVPQLRFET